jgi:hypothetical protein
MKQKETDSNTGLSISPLDYHNILNGMITHPLHSVCAQATNILKTPELIKKEYYQKQKNAKTVLIMAGVGIMLISLIILTFSAKKNNTLTIEQQAGENTVVSKKVMSQMNDEGEIAIRYASALSYELLFNAKNIHNLKPDFTAKFTSEGFRQYLQQINNMSSKMIKSEVTDFQIISVSGLSMRTFDGNESYDIHLKLQQKNMIINMNLNLIKNPATDKILIDTIKINGSLN